MPCYLFTYHAYGSWLPDHPRGYVRRRWGVLPSDQQVADRYRAKQQEPTARFARRQQEVAINAAKQFAQCLDCRLHYLATSRTHVHALVSWRDETPWQGKRSSLKKSLTIQLKEHCGDRTWLSDGASRKRVKDEQHFQYLMKVYLPKHEGLCWSEEDEEGHGEA